MMPSTAVEKTPSDLAGSPPVIDLVHLGFGPDGPTGSPVPYGKKDVSITKDYSP